MEHSAFQSAALRPQPDPSAYIDDLPPADQPALEVTVRWGDSVLHVAHLSPPRPFIAGEGVDADFKVAQDSLGSERVVLPPSGGSYTHPSLSFEVI